MTVLARCGHAVWEFVIGDDWRLAGAAAAGIGIVAVLAGLRVVAWWVLPVAIPLVLAASVRGSGGR